MLFSKRIQAMPSSLSKSLAPSKRSFCTCLQDLHVSDLEVGGLTSHLYVSWPTRCGFVGQCPSRSPAPRSIDGHRVKSGVDGMGRLPCIVGDFPCFQLDSTLVSGPGYWRGWGSHWDCQWLEFGYIQKLPCHKLTTLPSQDAVCREAGGEGKEQATFS
jgi:hypothetical protein